MLFDISLYGGKVLKKVRTATITFHKAINYGAILQTYALQKSILKLGIDNDIIDYDCKLISNEYKFINLNSIRSFVRSFIKSFIGFRLYYCKKEKFKLFIKKYIVLTNPVTKNVLKSEEFNNKYDFFITGSDQVWNCEITNFDKTYMLDFVEDDKKKKSYAASFGIEKIPSIYELEYKSYLEKFSTILLREQTGARIVENLLNKKVETVLDPVFLLSKEEWNKIIKPNKFDEIQGNYILVYMPTVEMKIFAEDLSKKYNLPIYNITEPIIRKKNSFGKIESSLGPDEFISAIKNAKYVVTASFHATVFSIIYNKEFFININSKGKSRGSRLIDLLELLGINNREISERKIGDFSLLNWKDINKKLQIEKERSLKNLKQMLEVE